MFKFVWASVLKPADDGRLYQKMGLTLREVFAGGQFHFVGSARQTHDQPEGVVFHPIYSFSRRSLRRLLANVQFGWLLWRVRPDWIVVATVELLPAVVLYRCFSRCRVVYDVQENYALNVLHTSVYPRWMRRPLAWLLRLVEYAASFWLSGYILAERCYAHQLQKLIAQKPWVVVENTCLPCVPLPQHRLQPEGQSAAPIVCLLSGTLSPSYGTEQALLFFERLQASCPQVWLWVVGYCPEPSYRPRLKQRLAALPQTKWEGIDYFVPQARIQACYTQAHWAWLPYPVHGAFAERIPSKLFDCVAFQLPVLMAENEHWQAFLDSFPTKVGLCVPFAQADTFDYAEWVATWQQTAFFTNSFDPAPVLWSETAPRLVAFFQKLAAQGDTR
ncbi:MAG TPA: hypothetical protein DCM08_01535 [Microscillaceae bacterium]|nr:hypothetical protein [Microscillaceae bacterium]